MPQLVKVPCPGCGHPMRLSPNPDAMCRRCWKVSRDKRLPERWPVLDVGIELVCPHCITVSGSCCVCSGTRTIVASGIAYLMTNVWARPGCICAACRHVGTLDHATTGTPKAAQLPPLSPFADGFARRERAS